MTIRFANRADAGRRLGDAVVAAGLDVGLVLGLARGGVPVAAEVARRTGADVGVVVVRKVGAPGHPELAVGALAETGTIVWDDALLSRLGLTPTDMADAVPAVRSEIERQVAAYRGGQPPDWQVPGAVVLVDDGLATGSSVVAAVRAVRERTRAQQVVVAVPVASRQGLDRLRREADDVVAVEVPHRFRAVSTWYDEFGQTDDDEVLAALRR